MMNDDNEFLRSDCEGDGSQRSARECILIEEGDRPSRTHIHTIIKLCTLIHAYNQLKVHHHICMYGRKYDKQLLFLLCGMVVGRMMIMSSYDGMMTEVNLVARSNACVPMEMTDLHKHNH